MEKLPYCANDCYKFTGKKSLTDYENHLMYLIQRRLAKSGSLDFLSKLRIGIKSPIKKAS